MNADAEVIREQSALLADWADNSADAEDVDGCRAEIIAALERLEARVEQAERMLEVLEASQIPVIPRAAHERLLRAERDRDTLREALEALIDWADDKR